MREAPTTGATQLCGQEIGGIECPAPLKLDGTCNARMAGTCIATGRPVEPTLRFLPGLKTAMQKLHQQP